MTQFVEAEGKRKVWLCTMCCFGISCDLANPRSTCQMWFSTEKKKKCSCLESIAVHVKVVIQRLSGYNPVVNNQPAKLIGKEKRNTSAEKGWRMPCRTLWWVSWVAQHQKTCRATFFEHFWPQNSKSRVVSSWLMPSQPRNCDEPPGKLMKHLENNKALLIAPTHRVEQELAATYQHSICHVFIHSLDGRL